MSLMTLTRPTLAIAIAATLTLAGAAQAGTVLPTVGSGTLKLHLSADTDVTTGATFTWEDQSTNGNDFTQSTGAAQPTVASGAFNGNDAIRFDGTDDFLTSINELESTEHDGLEKNYTLFISAKGANADGLLATGANRTSGNKARTGFFKESDGDGEDFENVNTSFDGVGIGDPLLATDGSGIEGATLAIRYDRPKDILSKEMDLTQKVLGTTTPGITVTGDGARGDWYQAWGGATSIGGTGIDPSNPGTFFDGDVFEVVLYEGTLSDSDRDAVLNEMAKTAEIPEPATLALLGLGGAVMLSGRKRRSA